MTTYVMASVMIIIFIIVIMYGLYGAMSRPKFDCKMEVAYIYSTNAGWKIVDQQGENMLLNERLPDDIKVTMHNISNLDDIPCTMERLYKSGVRNFVGFSSSEMLKRALPFFKRHPDTQLISNGSTVTELEGDPRNIYRLTLTDQQNLYAMQSIYKIPSVTILAESDDYWSQSIMQDALKLWPGSKHYIYDSSSPNWAAMDDTVAQGNSNNLIIFALLDIEILPQIINRYPGKNIYLGDGSYAADLEDIERRTVRLVSYFGFNSSLYQKYPNPFVINLMDSISIWSWIVKNGGTPESVHIVGYNGDTTFDDAHMRQYGRILTYTYTDEWLPNYIYATSEIGSYMAMFDLFR